MTENELKTLLKTVTSPNKAARAAAHAHWAALAKPLGGLGRLETMVEDAAALMGTETPDLANRAVLVLCADNGVVAQGVSQTDASVTRAVLENLAARRTSVCRMAAAAHCAVVPVDMGIAGHTRWPGSANCRVAFGTADFTQGPAMSRATGCAGHRRAVSRWYRRKNARAYRCWPPGRWASATPPPPAPWPACCWAAPWPEMTGRGAGLSDAGLRRKIDAIRARHCPLTVPTPADPLGVLAALGRL